MHIATLAQVLAPDGLYRCDSMPLGRAFWARIEGGYWYVKPDGSVEPFDFRRESDKYRDDESWAHLGVMPRLAPDGRINIARLGIVLSSPDQAGGV